MKHTQLTDELLERASLYAAGAMTDSERQEYARHLEDDQCSVCRSEVGELQSAISLLAFTAPSAAPSPGVKDRLMEQAHAAAEVRVKPHAGFRWLHWVTAAVAVATIAVALNLMRLNNELRRQSDALNNRIAMLTSASRLVDLAGQGTNVQASGRIFWNRQQKQWLFYVNNLPSAPLGQIYQLWFVPKSGNPVSASTFNTDSNGSAEIEIPVPDEMTDLAAAAVTTEPAPGQPQPTGPYALLGKM